jgi:hypothetical protein
VIRTGIVRNPNSQRNRVGGARPATQPGVLVAAPETLSDLDEALNRLAAHGLDLLVIDGGDGAVREVVSRAPERFGAMLPPIAVLPSGKTNALALDLGAPAEWTLTEAQVSLEAGRLTTRAPLEITRLGAAQPFVRGFIFGAGVYVRAIELAQRAHALGAFGSFAVGATLAVAAFRTVTGGPRSPWRRGVPIRVGPPGSGEPESLFLLLASTLERFPLRLKPFGPPSAELRALMIDAPPERLLRALPPLLKGEQPAWLEEAGYRRRQLDRLEMMLDGRFVLDGEPYPGGELRIARGAELTFVKP